MPLHVRHLPGRCSHLVERQGLPDNVACFNPSKSGPYIYIRVTEHDKTHQANRILLVHEPSNALINVAYDASELSPTVNLFQGLEDLRILWHEGRVWFTATSTHASSHMTNEMVFGRLTADAHRVERFNVIDIGCRPVKNVVPFSLAPGSVALLDVWKSQIYHVTESEAVDGRPPQYAIARTQPLVWADGQPNLYRGSTSPVHLHGNTWGCVVHDIIFDDNTDLVRRLSYLHHWLELDVLRGVVTFVSSPFWVAHWGIEYVSGLDVAANGDVRLFLGVQDSGAIVCHTTLHALRSGK